MTTANLLIRRSIKSAASLAKSGLGLPRPVPGSINILAYHRVVKDITKAEKDAIYGIVISAETFRHHCRLLKRSFDVVSLETAMHFFGSRRRVARPMAVLTFDDGYRDFYEEAFPILNEFGLPATVFVPTAHIGQTTPLAHDRIFWLLRQAFGQPHIILDALRDIPQLSISHRDIDRNDLLFLTDKLVYLPHAIREAVISNLEEALKGRLIEYPSEYRLLDWEMIREMERKGINFGAHTANHVVLTLEEPTVMQDEIRASKAVLEERLGKRVVSFAYPNGEYSDTTKHFTAEAGFKVAVTTENRINLPGADLFTLGRTSLCEESTRGVRGTYSAAVAGLRLGV